MGGNLSTASIIPQCVRNVRAYYILFPAQLQNDSRARTRKIKIEIILTCKIKTHRNLSRTFTFRIIPQHVQWSSSNADTVGITAARPEYRGVCISEASNIGVAVLFVLLTATESRSSVSCCTLARKANQGLVLCKPVQERIRMGG